MSSRDDAHADHILRTVSDIDRSHNIIRINTEDFPHNVDCVFDGTDFSFRIKDSGRTFMSSQVARVWFRRPKEFKFRSSYDPYMAAYLRKQWSALLRGLYFCTHDTALWINSLPALHRARIKLQQLQLASILGLAVPETIVTNEAPRAREFANRFHSVCTKSLDEPSFSSDGHVFPLYTRIVSRDELEDDAAVSLCPILLQKYIEKECDIRVVVMGAKVFAVKIYSQSAEKSRVDVRGVSPDRLVHEECTLDESTLASVGEFVRRQGLTFAALDFVLEKDTDRLVFLECNPNGQWLWLERQCGVPLTSAMVELLGYGRG